MRVAIIGMGTAGVSVLRELVKHPKFNQLDIDLYDDKVNMGQGVPFQNDSSELLINMPSKDEFKFTMMRLNFGSGINNKLILILMNLHLQKFCFSDII